MPDCSLVSKTLSIKKFFFSRIIEAVAGVLINISQAGILDLPSMVGSSLWETVATSSDDN